VKAPQENQNLFVAAVVTDSESSSLRADQEVKMRRFVFAVLLSGATLLPVLAGPQTQEPEVAKRKERQQQRIANGVKSGKLSAGQTARLEGKEAKLNKETNRMRSANGGKLTAAEKAKVNRQQNKLSRQIRKDKQQ
jgi:starvation-inducible outer membrane lipoprotein